MGTIFKVDRGKGVLFCKSGEQFQLEGRIITHGQSAFQMRVWSAIRFVVLLGVSELLWVCDRERWGKSLHALHCRAQACPPPTWSC